MISRGLIKSTISSVLETLSELPPPSVRWVDEAQGSVWTGSPSLWIRMNPISSQGIDEESTTHPVSGDDTIVTMDGQRRFTLSVRCESFDQDISSPHHAANVADTIRIRLKRSSTVALWRGVLALETIQPTKRVDYKNQGRNVSCYVVDLMMRTADQDIDSTKDAGGWIGEAIIGGSIPTSTISLDVNAK